MCYRLPVRPSARKHRAAPYSLPQSGAPRPPSGNSQSGLCMSPLVSGTYWSCLKNILQLWSALSLLDGNIWKDCRLSEERGVSPQHSIVLSYFGFKSWHLAFWICLLLTCRPGMNLWISAFQMNNSLRSGRGLYLQIWKEEFRRYGELWEISACQWAKIRGNGQSSAMLLE